MSQSPVNITYSLEEILAKFDQRFDRLENKLDKLQEDVTELKVEVKVGQARIEEKLEGVNKRLEFQEFINKGVLVGLVVAIIGGAAKLFGWVGKP